MIGRLDWKILVVAGLAQAAAPSPQEPATFRVGTRLVEVDVVVRDKNGPVTGLTRNDFTVFDCKREPSPSQSLSGSTSWCKDKRQAIQMFRAPGGNSTPTLATRSAPPAGSVSNRVDSRGAPIGNVTVLLLDQLNTAIDFKAYERREAVKFLKTLKPTDRIAIYSLGKDLHILQDFTDDPQKLIDAVSHLDSGLDQLGAVPGGSSLGQPPPPMKTGDPVTDMLLAKADAGADALNPAILGMFEQITLEAVRKMVQHMSGIPGRKSLVWIKQQPNLPPGALPLLQEANIALYPVLVRGLGESGVFKMTARGGLSAPVGGEFIRQHAVEDLGASTGGAGFTDAKDLSAAVSRAEEDAGSVYLMGFYPSESDLDGKLHTLNVALSRKFAKDGLQVVFRTRYLATTRPTATESVPLADLFESPLDATAIGLNAIATPDPIEPGVSHLDITVDLADVQLRQQGDRWIGSLRITVRRDALDASGVIRPAQEFVQTQAINLTAEQVQTRSSTGFVVRQRWTGIGTGAGSLRIVVQDQANGAAGSLRLPLGK